jgi:hypothetical protein
MDVNTSLSIQTIKIILLLNIQTQHVLHWQLFLEDYAVTFHYIKGESNSLADTLSRLPFDERQNPPDWHNHRVNLYDSTASTKTKTKTQS